MKKDKNDYVSSDIIQMDPLDHIRERPAMYIGDTANPTKLLIECLDNALDEVSANYATKIRVEINTKDKSFSVYDNGRGIPFDPKADIDSDRPVLICNKVFTSGKFKKNESSSAYNIAVGLHGVGLSAVRALSTEMFIYVCRNKIKASYHFYGNKDVDRKFEKTTDSEWSTVFKVYPNKTYFESLDIDLKIIKERLLISAANFPSAEITLCLNNKHAVIKGTEEELVTNYLSKNVKKWFTFDSKYKRELDGGKICEENCKLIIGWDIDNENIKTKEFTTVNLAHVQGGIHVTKIQNAIRNVFTKLKKKDFEFDEADSLNWLRLYVNLKLVEPHFESQSKEKLSRKSKLEILDNLEFEIEKYFKKNKEDADYLLSEFEKYHKTKFNKKVISVEKKRGFSQFTKLRDCKLRSGELIISEGDSAVSGLIKLRDPNIHAILPLRGVPENSVDKKVQDLLDNNEINSIIKAVGTGFSPNCVIENIRYEKIILCSDADPAGHFINCLLMGLFIKYMPEIVKKGALYICEPPLFGYGKNESFVPIKNEQELEVARKLNKQIRRFKGLGEYSDYELKKCILDSDTRVLVRVSWTENQDEILKLLSDSSERKKLALGEWKLKTIQEK
jgi:DNA gyrase subunit B